MLNDEDFVNEASHRGQDSQDEVHGMGNDQNGVDWTASCTRG